MFRRIFCALMIVLFFTPLPCSADWPAFRGADGNGKSPDTGLLKRWPEDGPQLLWTADFIGFGWSGVAISGDRIYISGNVQRDGKDLTMIFCLDKDGNKIWEQDNGPANADRRKYPGTRGTPTIDGNFVYDINPFGGVTCLDAKTGKKIWSRNVMKDYDAPDAYWFLGHAVIVDGDHVITPVGGPKAMAVALNKRTGEPVWVSPPTVDPPGATVGYTTPYLFEFDGIRVITVMSDSTVEGIDAKTGKSLFSIPWKNRLTTNCTMPIYRNGFLFLSTGYDYGAKMFKLTKNANDTISPTEMWYEKRFDNHHGGVILVGDYVYGTSHNGTWYSINFVTGEIGYQSRVAGKGSVHYADGLLYSLSEDDKTVVLIKPEPKEYIELGRFELSHDAEGKSWAHPVVLNGRLYLRHAQYLYCYDVKTSY